MKYKIAGRSRDRRRRWSLALAYAVVLASCDSPFAPEKQEVERLDINPPVLTLVVGGSTTLTARVYGPNDAVMLGAKVFWSTQDPTVVTVNQAGQVNAIGAGTAQIAASSGGQSRTIAVTVAQKPIALVRIAPPAATVAAGQTFQLQGEALDGDGNVLPNRPLEWASNQPAVASVNGAGLVTGVAVGQATITAIGEGRIGTALVTVQPTPVASLTIQPNGGSLPAGGTMTFTATARDAGGTVLTGRTITWRSSNDAVATVSNAGLMTAISPGVVTITASAPGAGPNGTTPSATVNVTVLIEPVASAVIVPSPASVQVGQALTLTVNLFDSAGEPLSAIGRSIQWSSSNPAAATVNASGSATGVAIGTAIITATITTPGQPGTVQASVLLTVSNQPVASVVVAPSSGVVHAGYSRAFTATALDAQNKPLAGRQIVWTSSNQAIASVDAQSGLVTGIVPGAVQIRATVEGVQGVATVTVDLVQVSSVTVAPPSATLMPAQTVQLTAIPLDSASNTISGIALGGRTTTWASLTPSAATVSTSGLVTAVAVGSSSVTATIGGTPGQSVITVSPLPTATQLAILTQPSASAPNDAAFAQQPVVQLKDANGNNVATAGIIIAAAITAPGTGTLGGTLTATTNASGAATFTGLKITGTIGTRTLTFTSGALTAATSSAINVTHGAATQLLLVTPPPTTASSGQAFSTASVVQVQDVSGNSVTQSGILVTASPSPSAGVTLAGGSTTTDASGVATFGALTLTGTAGSYTLTFSSGSLAPATSGSITLSAGSGLQLSVLQQPGGTAQSGAVLSPQPQVQLLDVSNNPVAQAGVNISAAILSGGGSLGGTTVATTNSSGIATFTNLTITGTVGSRTLFFAAVGYTSVASNAINITAGPPAALVIATPPSSTAQSDAALGSQPAIQVQDASGNPVLQSGIIVTATLVGSGGSLIGGNTATTDGSGLATFAGLGIAGTVGAYSLSFSSGALPPVGSGSITLTAGAATQLTISTQPAGAASGSVFTTQPVIQVRDASGNATSVGGPFTINAAIASGPPGATLLGGSATTNGAGQATFSGLGLSGSVGSYTIAFTSAPLAGINSASITLTHGAAAQLVIQAQPGGATSGAAFTTQPVILVQDAQNNPVPGVTVSATPSAGATLVGPGSALSDGAGLATFSGLGLSGLAGNYTIDFSASGTPNVTSGSIALGAGVASKLVISAQPPASAQNGATTVSAAVQVQDADGNLVDDNGRSVTVTLGGSGAALSGTTAVNTASGVATFSGLTITGLVGNYTLSFTSSPLTGAGPSSAIALTPGAAAALVITAQPPASVASGATFSAAVKLQDASTNGISGVGITAALNGTGTLGGGSATTDATGVATFSGLSITTAATGTFSLTFSGASLTSSPTSNIDVVVQPTQLGMVTQPPATSASGATFGDVSVQLLDANSSPVNEAGVAVSVGITGGGATLIGTASANTDASGVATFSGLGIAGLVNNYTLTFTSTGLTSATSSAIALTPGAPAALVITAQPPTSVLSGATFSAAVTLQDASTNGISGVGITAALNGTGTLGGGSATTDAAGVATFSGLSITTTAAGTFSLTFSGASLTSSPTSNIAVTLPATQLGMVAQPPATSASGATFGDVSVQLLDVNGIPVNQAGVAVGVGITGGGATLIGTASANTDASGVATFSGLGIAGTVNSYTLTFTSGSLTSATSSAIALTHGAAAKIVFAPAPPSTASTGVPLASHGVQVLDAQDNPVTIAGIAVTVAIAPNATFAGTSANTDAGGLATFDALTITGNLSPPSYTLTYTAAGVSGSIQATVSLAFFDTETTGEVTEVTLANPDDRGEDLSRVSILPDEWSLADVGSLSGTPTLPAHTQVGASVRYQTIARANPDQVRYGAIRRGTVVSNPFGANP